MYHSPQKSTKRPVGFSLWFPESDGRFVEDRDYVLGPPRVSRTSVSIEQDHFFKNEELLSTHCVPGTVLGTHCILSNASQQPYFSGE